jgi:hypothetical protein
MYNQEFPRARLGFVGVLAWSHLVLGQISNTSDAGILPREMQTDEAQNTL